MKMRTLLCKNPLGFVIGRKSIEGRFDVNYYKPGYRELIKKLENSLFEVKRLGDIVSLSSERWKKPKSGTFRYIEINDIDAFSAQIIQAKELNVEDAPSRAQIVVRKDDIIVSTTRPYRGAIALVTEEYDGCICSTGFAVIREVKKEINRKYLLHILHSSIGLKQMEQRMTGGNYPAITPDELLKIWIPIPSMDIQNKIVDIMDKALKEKKESEKEAKFLLNSVDDYLMEELGITLPELEDKGPLAYAIGARYLIRRRWDIEYWKPIYIEIEKAIKSGKYNAIEFGRLIDTIINGFDYRKFTDEGTKYLRVGNIKPFVINETNIKHIPLSLNNIDKEILLKKNDILLTRKGTFGVAAIVEKEDNYIISSEIFRIRIKERLNINTLYIAIVLNSTLGRYQFSRKSVGAIMGSLSQEAVKSIFLPLPPRSIQDKIANEVKRRIERAKELQKKGEQIVTKAKKEIERIILGEKNYE